ncbi:MAG: hypothetical protein QF612_00095 [Candidatus Thalassarchaeaceae archaeon]|nr:hypothetical protein [Candidatus Thalassarchaeaceae archaeon]
MRTCAMVLGLFLILMTASSIPAEQLSSVGTIDEPELDWEGAGTSTLIYEGQLSDPQDLDNITLGDDAGAVHFIQLVSSDEALKITVREDGEIHGEEVGSSVAFLLSGTGNAMWVEISNVNFTSPNSYQIHIHSNSADEDVELGDLTASGYIHESDTEGDRSYFSTGGNAAIEIQWFGADMTEFVGYMTQLSNGDVTELDFDDNSTATMTLHTPAVDSRFENYEFTIWARTDGVTGVWSLNKTILSEGDALCPHDCPNTVDETRFHSEAVTIENERWATDGNLSGQDTVDVYPIFIQGDSWEVHRLIATIEGDDSLVQIQSWDNSGEFLTPLDVADGSGTVGLNMTPGYHLVKVSRSNSAIGTNAYHLDLLTINVTSGDAGPEGEIVDQWREFIPFYIGIGLVMLAPMGYVLWSLRGTKLADEVQAHERGRLKRLRERLARLIESDGSEHEISSALEMLEAVQWKATVAEMGEATLTHHTDSVTLKAWRMGPGSLLVGIHVEQAPWNLAALRFEAAGGPSWKITKVSPNSLYDGDEIFLDTLEVGSTRFLGLQLEGSANGLDLHLSGLVEGKPLAAIPARALLMEDE